MCPGEAQAVRGREHSGSARLATALSLVLNPSIWGGGFVVFLATRFEPPGPHRWAVAALGFVVIGLLPVGLLFVMKALGQLDHVDMPEPGDRGRVYAICAVLYATGGLVLTVVGASWPVLAVVGAHVPATLTLAALNRRWKVSIHAAGLAGILAAALVLFGPTAWPLALALGLGAWARWGAGAHTAGQLAAGAAVGSIFTGGILEVVRAIAA